MMALPLAIWTLLQIFSFTLGAPREECNPRCTKQVELGIVLDSSSSISRKDFATAKTFLQNYLKNFDISQEGVRVSIITYGLETHPEHSFNLTTYDNIEDINQAIERIPHMAQTYTNTGAGIKFMVEHQLSEDKVRPGIPKVAVIITDGNSQVGVVTEREANLARGKGIALFAIGVGHEIEKAELLRIAGGDESRVDIVNSYDKLMHIKDWLAKEVCSHAS